MLVKCIKSASHSHAPKVGKEYLVYACIFTAGDIPNRASKLEYYVEEQIDDGRAIQNTLIFSSAENFEMLDASVPEDWHSAEIDLKEKYQSAAQIANEQDNAMLAGEVDEQVLNWGTAMPRLLIVSFPEMLDFDFYIAVHDDNMSSHHHEVIDKYRERYKQG